MKTQNGFGFFALSRPDKTREPGKLARLFELLGRGSIPVDGGNDPALKPAPERRPQPVRWGNFR
jgi:hypothetical protein